MENVYRSGPKQNHQTRELHYEKVRFSKWKIITCACGQKILVLPNVAAMSRAFKSHSNLHKGSERYLIKKLFKAITQ